MKRFISEEVDRQLGMYIPNPAPQEPLPPGVAPPTKPELSENVADAPLIRLFNFLRTFCVAYLGSSVLKSSVEMMALSYQLEILWYQVSTSLKLSDVT
jgi:mediator of RNA polymerase II transcription subunit 14